MRYIFLTLFISIYTLSSTARAEVALWRVEGPHGAATLIGTMHLLPDGKDWVTKRLKRAVKDADLLVLETKSGAQTTPQLRRYALTHGFVTPGGATLPELLGQNGLKRLRAAETQLDIPPRAFDSMQPWYAALNLSLAYVMQEGYAAEAGVEAWLWRAFDERDAPIEGLEDAIAGLKALSSQTPQVQLDMLQQSLEQVEAGGDDLAALYTAWRTGNLSDLAAFLAEENQMLPSVRDAVLIARNRAWLGPLKALLATPAHEFIAVGAAHLTGPDNLIELLEAEGYAVTRLN